MNWTSVLGAAIALGCLAACAGYDGTEARYESAEADVAAAPVIPETEVVGVTPETDVADAGAAPESDPEQYRISVEIPVDDVTIDRGENLDVDALLDERTSFTAADFHLREVILVARSRRGGSAELIVDEWASGAVDIPQGAAESWYEVRIPAPDVGEGGADWMVDFTGALDLNLLVAVLEPRAGMLAAATATVREVVVDDGIAVDPAAAVEVAAAEVVQAVEVVEPAPTVQTVVNEVIVERPVYETRTVYRYVDRPIHSYRVSWVYDPARYYVFRDYYGWTYRYFPGTWDWRCYDLSFRLPRHHHHRDRDRHRTERHDGRRFERRDRDRRGDRDRRRDDRDGRDRRERDRRGDRHNDHETRAVVSRPRAFQRRVDSRHPRVHIAGQREAVPRARDLVSSTREPANPRLRVQRRDEQSSNGARVGNRQAQQSSANPRLNPFQRRDSGVAASPSRTVASRSGNEANGERSPTNNRTVTVSNVRPRTFERRGVQQPDRPATPTARTRTFQRETDRRTAVRSEPRLAEPRRTTISRSSASSNAGQRRAVDMERGNARTRTFQRSAPRVVEPTRPRTQPPRTQSRPRATAPVRSTPRQTTSQTRPQRAAPTRNTSRPAPQRDRPVKRSPAQPKSDSASETRSEEGSRGNARKRAFERR